MKLYRNLCEAVVSGLELIFTEKKYADKVIEKILKSNPKWGARDRRFIAETIYDIVRWYRLFIELTGADEDDYWKLLAVWCLWNKVDFPDWAELKGVNRKKILENYEQLKTNRKIRESIPDWLDELGVKELGTKWEKELEALNEEAKVVLRVNTIKISRLELQKQLLELE
ncbi:MAG: RNA methyltransferase, partial [Cytophagales bacterium]|nr:RNA methyltransferase [Cytophagales bacterium]